MLEWPFPMSSSFLQNDDLSIFNQVIPKNVQKMAYQKVKSAIFGVGGIIIKGRLLEILLYYCILFFVTVLLCHFYNLLHVYLFVKVLLYFLE